MAGCLHRIARALAQSLAPTMILGTVAGLLLSGTGAPVVAFAQSAGGNSSSETVTVQVDTRTPTGTTIIGTVVVKRISGSGQANITFDGTVNGQRATAQAAAKEQWSGNSSAIIHVTEITSWNVPLPKPGVMDIDLEQAGTGLITINGIPLAASAPLAAPGSGSLVYSVTNPGAGEGDLTLLPQTGQMEGILFNPLPLVIALVTAGPVLILLGTCIARLSGLQHIWSTPRGEA